MNLKDSPYKRVSPKWTDMVLKRMRRQGDELLGDRVRLSNFVHNRLFVGTGQGNGIGNPVTKVWKDWSFTPNLPAPIWLDLRSLKCFRQLQDVSKTSHEFTKWVSRTLRIGSGLY